MYNLRYANLNATVEEIHNACRAAHVHDSIMAFPEGYNKNVGVHGSCLSGGEKQRLAIARVLLRNPRIILLDETTAAIDTGTEEHIQPSLKQLAAGRTVIIVAHRLSTVINANQILAIHEGKVVEGGTHKELLDRKDPYAEMWQRHIKNGTGAKTKDNGGYLRRIQAQVWYEVSRSMYYRREYASSRQTIRFSNSLSETSPPRMQKYTSITR
ncbi:hypothetical protein POX_f07378 [Penicillium oxalicum]|uniref:hypothetical protein n=1 Tax=Penicillium oxalicum TaxID=69781 RepID=UPI0020B83555|nr:hypothetical protein POX_f07378 [Penicillium oxalicum]KAI2787025.1 hypothetical protein POX_f07378 [Penicillium oxalicum]